MSPVTLWRERENVLSIPEIAHVHYIETSPPPDFLVCRWQRFDDDVAAVFSDSILSRYCQYMQHNRGNRNGREVFRFCVLYHFGGVSCRESFVDVEKRSGCRLRELLESGTDIAAIEDDREWIMLASCRHHPVWISAVNGVVLEGLDPYESFRSQIESSPYDMNLHKITYRQLL